jgi:hypothetical protein
MSSWKKVVQKGSCIYCGCLISLLLVWNIVLHFHFLRSGATYQVLRDLNTAKCPENTNKLEMFSWEQNWNPAAIWNSSQESNTDYRLTSPIKSAMKVSCCALSIVICAMFLRWRGETRHSTPFQPPRRIRRAEFIIINTLIHIFLL